ncbi:MAG TPA: hypothetical protein PKW56_04740 [Clostridiales bacterium]|nr:hypothetical protein [Clostridiales bacterium]
MKKIIIASISAMIWQAYAIFGIGGHIGVDNTSVSSQNLTLLSINGLDYNYTLAREEFKNPLCFGAQLYLDIPVVPIGFELGFEGAWATYSWKGSDTIGGYQIEIPGYTAENSEFNEEFDFAKIGVDITAKWYIFSLPPVVKTVKFYVGGGTGFYFITPIVTDKMIIAELEKRYTGTINSSPTLDIDEYIEKVTVMGFHFVTGAQIKFPVIPLSFNVDYKYVSTPENDYSDETNKFSVIKGSINFYL